MGGSFDEIEVKREDLSVIPLISKTAIPLQRSCETTKILGIRTR